MGRGAWASLSGYRVNETALTLFCKQKMVGDNELNNFRAWEISAKYPPRMMDARKPPLSSVGGEKPGFDLAIDRGWLWLHESGPM